MLILFLFLVLILSIMFTIEPTNFKKENSWICKKLEQTCNNLTNVFDFMANIWITLRLMKSNGCVPLLIYYKILKRSHNLCQWVDTNSI